MKPFLYSIQIIIVFLCSSNQFAQYKLNPTNNTSVLNSIVTLNDLENNIIVYSIINNNSSDLIALSDLSKKHRNVKFIAIFDDFNYDETTIIKEKLKHYNFLSKKENDKVFEKYQTDTFKIFPIHVLIDSNGDEKYKKKGTSKNIEIKLSKRINKIESI